MSHITSARSRKRLSQLVAPRHRPEREPDSAAGCRRLQRSTMHLPARSSSALSPPPMRRAMPPARMTAAILSEVIAVHRQLRSKLPTHAADDGDRSRGVAGCPNHGSGWGEQRDSNP